MLMYQKKLCILKFGFEEDCQWTQFVIGTLCNFLLVDTNALVSHFMSLNFILRSLRKYFPIADSRSGRAIIQ